MDCLASPLTITPWPVIRNGRRYAAPFRGAFTHRQAVAVWFQVLFRPRQRLFSAFTHATTALSVSGRIYGWKLVPPKFTRDFQRTLLKIPGIAVPVFAYGTFTLYGRGVPPHSANRFVQTQVLQLHISYGSHHRIRFAVFRVRSPLLTESQLISFPPPTKMLQFGGCPLLTELCDLRSQKEVPFGYPGFNASLRLHRAYRGLARPSSAPEPSHSPNGVITANCVGPTFFCVCG